MNINNLSNVVFILTITLFSGFFFCCNNPQNKAKLKLDCQSINELINRDQHLRSTKLKSRFFHNVDSLVKLAGYEAGLDQLSSIDGNLKDSIWVVANELVDLNPLNERQQAVRDSFWTIQNEIDSLNTLQVIVQIEQFGIDSLNKVDKQCNENSLLVFVHCPNGLKEKVRVVIEDNKEGVGKNRFRHISWHLDGRN